MRKPLGCATCAVSLLECSLAKNTETVPKYKVRLRHGRPVLLLAVTVRLSFPGSANHDAYVVVVPAYDLISPESQLFTSHETEMFIAHCHVHLGSILQ